MKQLSFRLRFAILSAFLAGSALTGFCFISWSLIYKDKLTRLDSELKDLLRQESFPPRPKTEWLYSEIPKISLSSVSGKDAQTSIPRCLTPVGEVPMLLQDLRKASVCRVC